jgi:hypothetical protein
MSDPTPHPAYPGFAMQNAGRAQYVYEHALPSNDRVAADVSRGIAQPPAKIGLPSGPAISDVQRFSIPSTTAFGIGT